MDVKELQEAIARVQASSKVTLEGGKQYTTVAARVEALRIVTGSRFGIETEIVYYPKPGDDPQTIVMKAVVTDGIRIVATGHAEETRGANWINETSALEACETSCIGRALAALALHGGEYASVQEIAVAQSKRARITGSAPIAVSMVASPNPIGLANAHTQTAGLASKNSEASSFTEMPTEKPYSANATNTPPGGIGWETAVETFRTFARECHKEDDLKAFWDRNRGLIDRMKIEAVASFSEVRDIFASRQKTIQAGQPFNDEIPY